MVELKKCSEEKAYFAYFVALKGIELPLLLYSAYLVCGNWDLTEIEHTLVTSMQWNQKFVNTLLYRTYWYSRIALKCSIILNIEHPMAPLKLLTCLERLSLVWVCWACWVCCVSVRPCCPATLLSLVWGWVPGACNSVEQEVLDELSSTDPLGHSKLQLQLTMSANLFKSSVTSMFTR